MGYWILWKYKRTCNTSDIGIKGGGGGRLQDSKVDVLLEDTVTTVLKGIIWLFPLLLFVVAANVSILHTNARKAKLSYSTNYAEPILSTEIKNSPPRQPFMSLL